MGKRGRPPIYGAEAVSLAKRAGHRQGWQGEEMVRYGTRVLKTYKTFLATWRPAGGVVRVVVVMEEDGWRAFVCTDPTATAERCWKWWPIGTAGNRRSRM